MQYFLRSEMGICHMSRVRKEKVDVAEPPVIENITKPKLQIPAFQEHVGRHFTMDKFVQSSDWY
jgi:hypothetical protein